MIDITTFKQFVDLANNAEIGDSARITAAKGDKGQITATGAVETNVFSRLMERTFRSADAKKEYSDIRKQLIDTLTHLFGAKNFDELPDNVRHAFVDGEVVCERPLTKRRLAAVMTAAQNALGYADSETFKKNVVMHATIDKIASDQEEDKSLLFDEDDLGDQVETYAEDLTGEEGYTGEELQNYFTNDYSKTVGNTGFFNTIEAKDAAASQRINRQAEKVLITLEKVYINHGEAKRVKDTIDTIFTYLGFCASTLNPIANAMSNNIHNALRILDGKDQATKSEISKAANFLRKLVAPRLGDKKSLEKMINSFGSYVPPNSEGSNNNIRKIYAHEIDTAKKNIKSYADVKNLPKDMTNRMINLASKLSPFGTDIGRLAYEEKELFSLNVGYFDTLKQIAELESMSGECDVNERDTLDTIAGKYVGAEAAGADDSDDDLI